MTTTEREILDVAEGELMDQIIEENEQDFIVATERLDEVKIESPQDSVEVEKLR